MKPKFLSRLLGAAQRARRTRRRAQMRQRWDRCFLGGRQGFLLEALERRDCPSCGPSGPNTVCLDFDSPATGSGPGSIPTRYGRIIIQGELSEGFVPGGSGNGLRSRRVDEDDCGPGKIIIEGGLVSQIQYRYGGGQGKFKGTAYNRHDDVLGSPFSDDDTTDDPPSEPVIAGGINKAGMYIQKFEFCDPDPFHGHADIDDVLITFADVTLSDLVSDAIPFPTIAKGYIEANFDIKRPIEFNLEDAAALGNFDHFNWYQEVTYLPSGPPRAGFEYEGPDPLPGGNYPPFSLADFYPAYWDEYWIPSRSDYHIDAHTSYGTRVDFSDEPDLFLSGNVAEYATYLVGVPTSGDQIVLNWLGGFTNTAFVWRYTQTTNKTGAITDVRFLQNIDPARAGGAWSTSSVSSSPRTGARIDWIGCGRLA